MAALQNPSQRGSNLVPKPKMGVDRKALREELSRRYEHTLRRLGS